MWTSYRHLRVLKKGQKVDAVILSLEPEKRIALGLKQVSPILVKEIPEVRRDEVKCQVLKLTDWSFLWYEAILETYLFL